MGLRWVGLLEKSQPTSRGADTVAVFQLRPMMEAVAINSSSSAIETLPETA